MNNQTTPTHRTKQQKPVTVRQPDQVVEVRAHTTYGDIVIHRS